jgi:hypothetical protein
MLGIITGVLLKPDLYDLHYLNCLKGKLTILAFHFFEKCPRCEDVFSKVSGHSFLKDLHPNETIKEVVVR